MNKEALKIVISDDDGIIRFVLKKILKIRNKKTIRPLKVYSSGNGLEALGLIFATRADISILDTTLPKYSGREVFEYLATNDSYVKENKLVILIDDGSIPDISFDKSFAVISKFDPEFSQKLRSAFLSFYYYLIEKNEVLLKERQNLFKISPDILNKVIHSENRLEALGKKLESLSHVGFFKKYTEVGKYIFIASFIKLRVWGMLILLRFL